MSALRWPDRAHPDRAGCSLQGRRMVQGPLLLCEACDGQQRQGCDVGRRCIEVLGEFYTGSEFFKLGCKLEFVEHERYLRASRSVKELILLAASPRFAVRASDSKRRMLTSRYRDRGTDTEVAEGSNTQR